MAFPQDDSLVFADDTRWRSKHNDELPNTSNFSPISDKTLEPTQIDQSTSPVFPERSYSSLDEHDFSLSGMRSGVKHALGAEEIDDSASLAKRTSRLAIHIGDNEAEGGGDETRNEGNVQKNAKLSNYGDTQVILARPLADVSDHMDINDTQTVGPMHGSDTQVLSRERKLETLRSGIREFGPDTQVIGPRIEPDTQVIGPRIEPDTQVVGLRIEPDTQVIGTKSIDSDTQVIRPRHIESDTQVIDNGIGSDTQLIQNKNSDLAPDTQEVHMKDSVQFNIHNHADHNALAIPKKSPEDSSALWNHTQPITQLPRLQPDTTTQVQSSPNKLPESELDSTLLLSPARHLDEPTTQVLNTQEELFEEISCSVDLGHKPVYSSGQNEEKLQSQLSIISNDDDMRLEENNMLYEDSVFRHKSKKRRMETEPETEPETYMNEDESAMDKSPTSEIFDGEVKANITHKMAWSQSSSELEDVSHDVQDLDLSTFGNMKDYDDSIDRIIVPNKRRRNEIPPTQSPKSQSQKDQSHKDQSQNDQSQKDQSQNQNPTRNLEKHRENHQEYNEALDEQNPKSELRQEILDTLDVQNIVNPTAVWAFSLFKHYPARVIKAGETTSLIEFADLAQIEVKNTDLYLLDLRIGDAVHLILNMGEYVVTGLAEVYPEADFQCIRGYDTVFVAKKGRHMGKELQLPISNVFMEVGEWASHQQKFHIYHEHIDLVQENFGVVKNLIRPYNEIQDFPISANISPRKLTDTNGRSLHSNVFEGMVFFVTSIEGERKDQLAEMIFTNGGAFIDDEIKHYTIMDRSADGRLRLSLTKFDGFHFGALLSDGYSRSPKYLQALALGWPILAECFIEQAINNPEMLDNWQVYLLPAGQSLITNGVKSLEVFDFRMNCAKEIPMNGQFGNNMHLLAAYNVVILNKKQDNRALDMCGFIFHAYGAQSLQQCMNVLEVNSVLQNSSMKKVLVYDNAAGEYASSQTRKSLRRTQKLKPTIGIIDWEWVVQSVISGYVWKPRTMVTL